MDYDKYGHCVRCHKSMIIEAVIDGKPTIRFTPDYREHEYLLDDGSKMRVAVCKICKHHLKETPDEFDQVMDCVKKGWEKELEQISWDDDKKKKYMAHYGSLNIVTEVGTKSTEVLENQLSEYKKKGHHGTNHKDLHV